MNIERFLGRNLRRRAVRLCCFLLIVCAGLPAPAQDIGHLGVDADPTPLVQARRPARRVVRNSRTPVQTTNPSGNTVASNISSNPSSGRSGQPLPEVPKIDEGNVRPVIADAAPVIAPPTPAFEQILLSAENASQGGQYELALETYRRAQKQRPDSIDAQLGVAEALFDLRRLPDAEREFRAVLERQPANGDARRGLGDTLYDLRRWRDSVASYQSAIDAGLNDSAVYNNYANALFRTGTVENKARAVEYYRKAIDLQPSWPSAYAGLANALRGQRGPDGRPRLDEALAAATKGVELGPDLSLTRSVLGRVYADLGQFDRALAEGNSAVKLAPKDPYAYINLGGIYYAQKRYDQAEAAYKQAIALDPQWAFPYNALGTLYLNNLARLGDASLQFSKAILLEPNSPTLRINFGAARARSGDYNEAVNQLLRAIEIDPKSISAHHNLGLVYAVQKRYPEAAAAFQKATELDPTRAEYFIALGDVYKLMGRKSESDAAYDRARALGARIEGAAKPAGKSDPKSSGKGKDGKSDGKDEKKKKKN
ncbi:MAG: tetratricopeptide repeat protein [Blastocatellales bacterium]|nr:tetratricopeptide repeat protein [Blastocatellales bacterium]